MLTFVQPFDTSTATSSEQTQQGSQSATHASLTATASSDYPVYLSIHRRVLFCRHNLLSGTVNWPPCLTSPPALTKISGNNPISDRHSFLFIRFCLQLPVAPVSTALPVTVPLPVPPVLPALPAVVATVVSTATLVPALLTPRRRRTTVSVSPLLPPSRVRRMPSCK
jgi:hypothetical protein